MLLHRRERPSGDCARESRWRWQLKEQEGLEGQIVKVVQVAKRAQVTQGPKKGKSAALAAKQSQAAELEVGAGVALVAMVGLVALVATKVGPSVAAEDEPAPLTAVPSLAAAADASPVMV